MSTKYVLFLTTFLVIGCFLQGSLAKRIYVKQAEGDSASARQRIGEVTNNVGTIKHEFQQLNSASFEVPDDFDVASLKGDPRFEHVEEVPQGSIAVTPNDPKLSEQWGIPSVGMKEAWDLVHWSQTRLRNISLAICDTGFSYDHPDLDSSLVIWQYNYVSDNYNTTDDHYHGTHVAGISAATTNNSVGVAGVAYGVNFMIGKVLSSDGTGYYDDWIKCIVDTTDKGANIINLSLQGSSSSVGLEEAVNYATTKGVLVVAAAGNQYNNGNPAMYPGAIANSFSVANLQSDNTRASSSTTNSFVDIAAPGTAIVNTVPGFKGYYGTLSGTSMAAPLVAGVAALMMAAKPGVTQQQIRDLLQNTATDLGTAGKDNEFGYGKINPVKAIKALLNEPPVISIGTSYELVLNEMFVLNVSCSATESFDECVSFNSSNAPSFMIITQLSATELMIEAKPVSYGSNEVTFTAVDTFDTSNVVTVTFTVPMPEVPTTSPVSSMNPEGSVTPTAASGPGVSKTPESKIVSNASQLQGVALMCLIIAALV